MLVSNPQPLVASILGPATNLGWSLPTSRAHKMMVSSNARAATQAASHKHGCRRQLHASKHLSNHDWCVSPVAWTHVRCLLNMTATTDIHSKYKSNNRHTLRKLPDVRLGTQCCNIYRQVGWNSYNVQYSPLKPWADYGGSNSNNQQWGKWITLRLTQQQYAMATETQVQLCLDDAQA